MLVQRFYLGFKFVTEYQSGGKNNREITSRVCTYSVKLWVIYILHFFMI